MQLFISGLQCNARLTAEPPKALFFKYRNNQNRYSIHIPKERFTCPLTTNIPASSTGFTTVEFISTVFTRIVMKRNNCIDILRGGPAVEIERPIPLVFPADYPMTVQENA